jgi:hypothetical protein
VILQIYKWAFSGDQHDGNNPPPPPLQTYTWCDSNLRLREYLIMKKISFAAFFNITHIHACLPPQRVRYLPLRGLYMEDFIFKRL